MTEILRYLLLMLPPALLAAAVFSLTRGRRLRRRGVLSPPWREAGLLVFVMFLAGLAVLTMMPRIRWSGFFPVALETAPGAGGINLVPGEMLRLAAWAASRGYWTSVWVNLPGNILMFVPLGFFPALLWDRPRWWKSVLVAFGTSFFIEFVQLFVARGTDIDDLILNTLGGFSGYGAYVLLRRFAPELTAKFQRKKVTFNGPKAGDFKARP